jgi:ribonuclease HI
MPIWLCGKDPAKMNKRELNSEAAKCLRDKHGVHTVSDAKKIATIPKPPEHREFDKCKCTACMFIKEQVSACVNPARCIQMVTYLLNRLPPKWDPRGPKPEDDEEAPSLEPESTPNNNNNTDVFDRFITTHRNLGDAVRIFTMGEKSNTLPQLGNTVTGSERLVIGTDGSCFQNGHEDARAGAGGYVDTYHDLNFAKRVPNNIEQSNQTGEMMAVLQAATITPADKELVILTDSKWTINELTKHRQKQEDQGYIGTANADLAKATVAKLCQCNCPTENKWIKGHNGHLLNEGADRLAAERARKPEENQLETNIPDALKVTGAKLKNMTQKLAYRAIRAKKTKTYKGRHQTKENIKRAKAAAEENSDIHPTEARIWKAMTNSDISRNQRIFMWMLAHNGYMVGNKWLRPNFREELQEQSECKHCETLESMDHILNECESPGQTQIWALAKEVLSMKHIGWHWPGKGAILTSPLAKFKDANTGERHHNKDRLYFTIMILSAQLIWAMRCERVIQNENRPFTAQEIERRWLAKVNDRLRMDCQLIDESCFGKKSQSAYKVRQTRAGVLMNKERLPEQWERMSGVLVGIDLESRHAVEGSGDEDARSRSGRPRPKSHT